MAFTTNIPGETSYNTFNHLAEERAASPLNATRNLNNPSVARIAIQITTIAATVILATILIVFSLISGPIMLAAIIIPVSVINAALSIGAILVLPKIKDCFDQMFSRF